MTAHLAAAQRPSGEQEKNPSPKADIKIIALARPTRSHAEIELYGIRIIHNHLSYISPAIPFKIANRIKASTILGMDICTIQ